MKRTVSEKIAVAALCCLLLSGCGSTLDQKLLSGAAIGAVTGAGIASVTKSSVLGGAGAGAAAGMVAGMATY